MDIAQVDDYVAISTNETLVVLDTSDPDAAPIATIPVRASVLGQPRDIFLDVVGSTLTLYVAGSEGLSVLEL